MAYKWSPIRQGYVGISTDTKPTAVDIGALLYEINLTTGIRKTYQTYDGGTTWTDISNDNCLVLDCVIAKDGTVSTEANISGYKYFSFLMPAGWDTATLTIKGSAVAGGTKQTIKNDVGQTFPAMTVAVDTIYSIDAYASMLASVPYISFVASAAQTTAARTIKLMCKA